LLTIRNIFPTFSSLTLISASATLPNMNGMIGTMVRLGVFSTVRLQMTQRVPNNVLLNVPSVLRMVVSNALPATQSATAAVVYNVYGDAVAHAISKT
jgi:hypothetical protein